MRRVMRTQIDVVLAKRGVLNADLPEVADLAELCDGEVILYATGADNEFVAAPRREAGMFGRATSRSCWPPAHRGACWARSSAVPGRRQAPDTSALLAAIATAWAWTSRPS
jgi:cyanophycin synthetase